MRTILSTNTNNSTHHPSTWHSPIPYLFGGLAAMLGLIAFALLILACSYWKLSGLLHTENEERDLGNVQEIESETSEKNESLEKVYDDKVLVIMAGNDKPTFLATPSCVNSTSLCGKDSDKQIQNHETSERLKENMDNDVQATSNMVSSSSIEVGVVPDENPTTEAYSKVAVAVAERGNRMVGVAADREARVMRYREKRKNRKFEKTIRYASRKAYAETRPRIKGRFAKRSDADSHPVDGYGVVPIC